VANIESKLISDVVKNEVRNQKFRNDLGLNYGQSISYMVMETKIDGATYYCCWSGGVLEGENVKLTEIGRAALETLMALPVGSDNSITYNR